MRFVIHPGTVFSKHDGDLHFISFRELADLYHLRPEDCNNAASPTHCPMRGDIELFPKYDGEYFDAREMK